MLRVATTFAAFAMLSACVGSEYTRDITETYVIDDRLHVAGTLNALTFNEIAAHLDDNPGLTTVVLEQIDGSIDDEVNLQTAMLIHEAGLDTYLPADGTIESGAVDLFCAGRNRIAERGARIGVHSWAGEDGLEGGALPRDDEEHEIYLEYFNAVDCPVSFYWFTLAAAPADGMHYMSEREWRDYEVVTEIRDPVTD